MTSKIQWKADIRRVASARRAAQLDRRRLSERIQRRVLEMPRVQDCHQVCCYVSFRSEVETRPLINHWLAESKAVFVPFCGKRDLGLFRLSSLDQLVPSPKMEILEPPPDLRTESNVLGDLSVLNLLVVPGLAFSPGGDRLGYGRGYYDRLLSHCPQAQKLGICFDCQIFDPLPVDDQDVPMDQVVTPTRTFERGAPP